MTNQDHDRCKIVLTRLGASAKTHDVLSLLEKISKKPKSKLEALLKNLPLLLSQNFDRQKGEKIASLFGALGAEISVSPLKEQKLEVLPDDNVIDWEDEYTLRLHPNETVRHAADDTQKPNTQLFYGVLGFCLVLSTALTIGLLFLVKHLKTAPYTRAKNFLMSNRVDKARAQINLILSQNPGNTNARILLARAHMVKAREAYDENHWKDYGKDPNDDMPSPELDSAIQELKRVLKENIRNPWPQFYLAQIYLDKGWMDKAEKILIKAKNASPGFWQARHALSVLHTRNGNTRRAISELENLKMDHPNLAIVYKDLGTLYCYYEFDKEKVIENWTKYLRMEQNDLDIGVLRKELVGLGVKIKAYEKKYPNRTLRHLKK